MRTFVILTASALLLAAAIVEISSRLWPESHLALLTLATLALFAQGLLGSRVIAGPAGSAAPAPEPAPGRAEGGRRKRSGRESRSQDSGSRDSGARDRSKPAAGAPKTAADTATAAPAGERESGTVKWFNRSKGFGFVIRESGEEIFVHQRSIRTEGGQSDGRRPVLRDGQAVTFVVVERDKGKQAEDVTPGP